MESDNLINNFELKKMCRMCLRQEKILKSLFYCSVADKSYAEIYENCTGFNISKDTNICSSSICSHCESNLLFVYEFRQKVQENEEKLEQLLLMKKQESSEIEIERDEFLGIDDNFLDYQIESLDELEKNFSECKFKLLINNSVKCITCLDDNCETEKTINRLNSHDSYSILCECGTLLANRANFFTHYAQKHIKCYDKNAINDEKLQCNNNNLKVVNRNESSKGKLHACHTCSMIFIREESLHRHLMSAHVLENSTACEFTLESIDEFEMISNASEIGSKKNYKKTTCPICFEQFNHRSTKINHMVREHQVKKAFECTYGCGYSTLKRDRFQAHIDKKHENPDKKFHCSICSQEFKSLSTMNIHRAKHSSSLTYLCADCDKIFLDKRNYTTHMRLHTRENLFHCKKCQRGFNRKEHLKNHMKRKTDCDKDANKC